MEKEKKPRGSMKGTLKNLGQAINDILSEIADEVLESVEEGVDKGAKYLKQKLENATPIDSGETRKCWEIGRKKADGQNIEIAKGVRYITNTAVNEQGIPITNLLEFGSKGKPFIRKTIAENQDEVVQIIKDEIQKNM